MDLMPIQSVSTEPAPPAEDVESADLTGFDEMIAALLAESGVGHAGDTTSKGQSGIDPDTGNEASDPPSTESGNTAAPPAADGAPAPPQPASLAISRGASVSPNPRVKATVSDARPDMTLPPDASGPLGDAAAPSTAATDEFGAQKQVGPFPGVPEPDAAENGASRGISSPASTQHQPAGRPGEEALMDAADVADVLTMGSHSGPTVNSATAANTNPTADSTAPVSKPLTNTDPDLTPDPATGTEPGSEGHEPESSPATPKTNTEAPSPAPKPPVDVPMPETAGEVPARVPEAQLEVERAAMAEVVDRLREWADSVDDARQPDSISLKLADPDGEVLIRLAMRDGRLELNVTRPGGEAPAWLSDQLDDALSRHGFDLSGGGPEAGQTDARWGGEDDKTDRRSGSQARRHQPDQSEGLWI